MKKTIPLICFIGCCNILSAQVALQPIVEHFTNTKCSICSSRNPGFYSNLNNHPGIHYISIHPSAPYPACPLSQQNTQDNDDRTHYYGVYGATPRLIINGAVIPSSTDYTAASLFTPYTGLTTPISMSIAQKKYGSDSMQVALVIKKKATINGTGKLFLGVAEDTVFLNGGNGETEHYNVFRKNLLPAAAQNISLNIAVGDSIVIKRTTAISTIWDAQRMFAFAILQNDTDKSLLQSIKTKPNEGITTSIEKILNQNSYKIYPNPANESLKIDMQNPEPVSLEIYNLTGKKLKEIRFRNHYVENILNYPPGLYFIKLTQDAKTVWEKIRIQK